MPETAKRTARVPILGEDGRISDDYIPAAIGENTAKAEAAATRAETAATDAEGSATAAGTSATKAQESATAAGNAKAAADTAQKGAESAKTAAEAAKAAAEKAKTGAESARGSAQTAASQAQQSANAAAESAASVADKFIASAQATTLDPGAQATASVEDQVLTIGVPRGEKGDTGEQGPQGEPGQDGQDATLPEGMVVADENGNLSSLGSDGEPSTMTDVVVENTANGVGAMMNTSGSSPSVSVMNSQTTAAVGFGLVDGEPVLQARKSQSGIRTYGFSPTIPEDDALTVVTSDAYKADTDPLKQRIAELEQQTQNVVTGTSTDLVSHGEDAFPQKPREVRIKGKTWVNRWPAINGSSYGVTVSTDGTGLITVSGTPTVDSVFLTNGQNFTVTPGARMSYVVSNVGLFDQNSRPYVQFFDADGGSVSNVSLNAGNSLTVPDGASEARCYIAVYLSRPVNGSFRVMLVDGTEAPDCFTPPASIASVETGKLVTSGKNLLPVVPQRSSIVNGVTITSNGDGSYTFNGTATDDIYAYKAPDTGFKLLPGTYTVSGEIAGQIYVTIVKDDGWLIGTNAQNKTIVTTTQGDCYFYLRVISGTTLNNVTVYPQLELGSTATAYEPPAVTETPLPEVELRSLPNGTCDELVIKEDGTCEVERKTGYIASYTDEEVTGEYVSTGNGLEAGASIVYELDEPTTEPQSPVTLPALPAPTFNQYHDADIPSDTSTEYVRDINIVLDNLAKQVAGAASAVAVHEASTIEEE